MMMAEPVRLELAGEEFLLFAERCALRVRDRTLIAADLHWGKAEVFQQSGIAIPSLVLGDDLRRLSAALEVSGARRLLLLGDLIHTRAGITAHVDEQVRYWRERHHDLVIVLIRGNHDRGFTPPAAWRIDVVDGDLHETPFVYTHEPPAELDLDAHSYYWGGHLHPTVRLNGRRDNLRLPCFAIGERVSILPAFSCFTGGYDLKRGEWKKLFVIAEDAVVEI